MTYEVLARKWRPRSFSELIGQEHVVRALVNALTRGQVHHAYLFTGTRGVGKTTLARILAKTLNCEEGLGPTPCGRCATCREIDEGRYVDLIEVDAASRTKVDQTRELLDNVPFAPVRGRHKVYLIDEVHMFSASSFNALLKTLEEPPDHVKFVLATTDPQKVPATVLSRCLQFNLKRLVPAQIKAHFEAVLAAEGIAHEDAALGLLASAADGSMRDGLSLLDQAIAFGAGRVGEADVRAMLGTRPGDLTLDLLDALAVADGARLLAEVARIADLTPDFGGLLGDLIALLHRIALAQQLPDTVSTDDPDRSRIVALAERMPLEDVQLFYQVLLVGQADLPLAPTPRMGLEMVLLRALAFRPGSAPAPAVASGGDGAGAPRASRSSAGSTRAGAATAGGEPKPAPAAVAASAPAPAVPDRQDIVADQTRPYAPDAASAGDAELAAPADWRRLVERAKLTGLARQLAQHCGLLSWDGTRLRLGLDAAHGHLCAAGAEQRLGAALAAALGREVRLEIEVGAGATDTPAEQNARAAAHRRAEAEARMADDPVARELGSRFDAQWVAGSIDAAE